MNYFYFFNKEELEKITEEARSILNNFEDRWGTIINEWLENSEVKKMLGKKENNSDN